MLNMKVVLILIILIFTSGFTDMSPNSITNTERPITSPVPQDTIQFNSTHWAKVGVSLDTPCGTYSLLDQSNVTRLTYAIGTDQNYVGRDVNYLNVTIPSVSFTLENSSGLPGLFKTLTNGVDDQLIRECIFARDNGNYGQSNIPYNESFALARNPDLYNEIPIFIRLIDHTVFSGATCNSHVTWEIWVQADPVTGDQTKTSGEIASISFTASLDSSTYIDYSRLYLRMNKQYNPGIGWNVTHTPGFTGSITFDVNNEPEFSMFNQYLFNGIDDNILCYFEVPYNETYQTFIESSVFSPDLNINSIYNYTLTILTSNRINNDRTLEISAVWKIYGEVSGDLPPVTTAQISTTVDETILASSTSTGEVTTFTASNPTSKPTILLPFSFISFLLGLNFLVLLTLIRKRLPKLR